MYRSGDPSNVSYPKTSSLVVEGTYLYSAHYSDLNYLPWSEKIPYGTRTFEPRVDDRRVGFLVTLSGSRIYSVSVTGVRRHTPNPTKWRRDEVVRSPLLLSMEFTTVLGSSRGDTVPTDESLSLRRDGSFDRTCLAVLSPETLPTTTFRCRCVS